ncbi:MAG: RNA 2',3'-cyclic phosphodiesterase [Synergistaceae bacterium]|nr:RNA 2',3'-cyclic phosphodiesterase [Synergistaceae bacterium]
MDQTGPKTRIFVCLPLDRVADELEKFIEPLRSFRDYRWVAKAQFHITLKFIGDAAAEHITRLDSNLSRVGGTRPFTFSLSSVGFFPNAERARTIWLGIGDDSGRLGKLAASVDRAAAAAGFETERRAFHPHVTLARARGERPTPPELLASLEKAPSLTETRDCFVLMKSVLTPAGAVYSPLARYLL